MCPCAAAGILHLDYISQEEEPEQEPAKELVFGRLMDEVRQAVCEPSSPVRAGRCGARPSRRLDNVWLMNAPVAQA